ncbi:alpha/beta hydrolase [Butyrivibrio sp. X503]|uniref:alpha/beta hydrolase n=1 Tax=Butyrivibrio sp. X503 TaxID=2364878 RepID=UPI001314FDAB|nr:alpha/beta fold hydrolase [Butyrivibrio sp. X503]
MKKKSENWKVKRMIIALVIVAVVIVAIKFILFPPVKEIPTTGKYQIASEDYWVTEDNEDPYSKNGGYRQLQVRKWYPIDCAEEKPVVVASHGSCGTIDNNGSLYRELASHGYTVLAVAHPGQAASVKYENGKSCGPSGEFLKEMGALKPEEDLEKAYKVFHKWMEIRTDDLNAVMDDWVEKEGATHFISEGHSLGGSAAYAMARIRDDVIGCIALESPFMYDIKGVEDGNFVFDDSDYDVPLLSIYSDASYPHLREWGQYGNNAKFLDSSNPLYTNIHYENIGHMGLCDLSLASPVIAAILDGGFQKARAKDRLTKLNEDCLAWVSDLCAR